MFQLLSARVFLACTIVAVLASPPLANPETQRGESNKTAPASSLLTPPAAPSFKIDDMPSRPSESLDKLLFFAMPGDNISRFLQAGYRAYKAGDLLSAYKQFKRVVEDTANTTRPEPSAARCRFAWAVAAIGIADCYAKQGTFEQSERLLEQACSTVTLDRDYWKIAAEAGKLYQDQKRYADADRLYQKAISAAAKANGTKSYEHVLCMNILALSQAANGNFKDAIDELSQGIEQSPADNTVKFSSFENLIYCYALDGDYATADKQAELALTETANSPIDESQKAYYTLRFLKDRVFLARQIGQEARAIELQNSVTEAQQKYDSVKPNPNVDFAPYMIMVQKKLKQHWKPPRQLMGERITTKFKVSRSGEITDVQIVHASDFPAANEAALNAIKAASPLPPLPQGAQEHVDIEFTFEYNVFPGARRFY